MVQSLLPALLVVVGGAARLYDVRWDQFQQVHPDERWIAWVADTIAWPKSLAVALDPERSPINPFRWPPPDPASGPLNSLAGEPRNYAYGHFPLYLLVATAHLAQEGAIWLGETTYAFPAALQPLHTVGRHLASYHYLPLVGRILSALADLGTLLLVYALARILVGRGHSAPVRAVVPLLAAATYAAAVLPIQLSHFIAVDVLLTFFVTATVALAALWAERSGQSRGGWGVWLLAGVTAGLAVGSKFSAILLALPLLVAAMFAMPPVSLRQKAALILGRLAAIGSVALLVFVATNPFAVIESDAFIRQIVSQNAMVSGAMDAPYTRQYIGTLPYLYFVQQLSQWGLGWPLGAIAWAGLLWAMARAGLRRASPALTVMLAWALPYFVTTGAFHTKFLRYMAPLLPFLLVFGAMAALDGHQGMMRRWGERARIVMPVVAAVTMVFTGTWAFTFLGVYRQEHPWIQASRWIYQNIPAGSKLLTESWDDALPLALDELPGRPARRAYGRVELPMWNPDTSEKLDLLVAELSTADYLVLASDRLSTPLSRLPVRYPMSSQYYQLLFSGDLGYRAVAEFTAYPQLGSLVVRDDHADESFYVYDHPHVLVFRNVDRLTPALLRARLGRYLPLGGYPSGTFAAGPDRLAGAVRVEDGRTVLPSTYDQAGIVESRPPAQGTGAGPVQGSRAPGLARQLPQAPAPDAPLTLSQPVDTLPRVADFRWNRLASQSAVIAVVLWWLVISLMGWVVWPLLFPCLSGLRDQGYGLARSAGWLLIGWIHWLGVSLGAWQNRVGPLVGVVAALTVLGLAAWVAQRGQIAAFWAERRRLLLGLEGLFALAYLAFAGVRLLNPDLWQPWNGGEKFMELAFLNAILRSPFFPPYDPYFAGGIINYYYYGFYLVSLPVKLTGIFPEVAFNLAVPGLFAMTATGIFSVAYSLAPQGHRRGAAWSALQASLASVVLGLLMGNLRGLRWLGDGLSAVLRGATWPRYDYWAASRVIPYTINEFPLWTFTFADLHPHLIAMPFGLLVVGLALNWLVGSARRRAWHVYLLALALGALGAVNTWDLPTYAILVTGVLLLAGWRARHWRALLAGACLAAATLLLSVAAYWPFYATYQPQVGGGDHVIGRFLAWTRAPSPLGAWLSLWGFFLLLALSYVAAVWVRERWMGGAPSEPAPRIPGATSDGVGAAQEASTPRASGRPWLVGLLGLVAVLALLAAAGRSTAAIAALPLCLALLLVCRRHSAATEAFVAWLLALGLGIVAGVELVYLRDFLEGSEWYRMNTLFKFSVPAWLLLSVVGGVMLRQVWAVAARAPKWIGLPWRAVVGVLLAGGMVFLAVGVLARIDDRFPGARPAIGTLDGTAYMTVGRYTWPSANFPIELVYEREAINWLLENVSGSPVIAEAPAAGYEVNGQFVGYDYYRAGGLRVASLTGFPTLVGQHQSEQRPGDQVWSRTELAREFFQTSDVARARGLARELRVGYIYVGRLERILFPDEGLLKFDVMVDRGDLVVAYRNDVVTIYQVVSVGS